MMFGVTDTWCIGLIGLSAMLIVIICYMVSQQGEKTPPWKLVKLKDGTVFVNYEYGTSLYDGVRMENSKIAKLILEAATKDDVKGQDPCPTNAT